MNNESSEKTMEKMWKHRDIKFATTEIIRNYLMSEANYHAKGNLLTIELKKKTKILINEPVYLGHSMLKLSK